MCSKLNWETNTGNQINNLNKKTFTEIALTSTINPWSGAITLVKNTKPIKSRVVNRTIPQITKAIVMFWIRVTNKNTTAKASKRFYIAIERM